jgi:hypothetical protein
MHYKNGREAKEGDSAIANNGQKIIAGTLHSLQSNATSCNAQLAYPVPGCVNNASVTVGECVHAEDAFNAMQKKT